MSLPDNNQVVLILCIFGGHTRINAMSVNCLRYLEIWKFQGSDSPITILGSWHDISECDTRKPQSAAQYHNQPSAGRNGNFQVDRQNTDPRSPICDHILVNSQWFLLFDNWILVLGKLHFFPVFHFTFIFSVRRNIEIGGEMCQQLWWRSPR